MMAFLQTITRVQASAWISAIIAIILIHLFPISTAKCIPEKHKLARIAYIYSWYFGLWGMFISCVVAPGNNKIFSFFGLIFFHTLTIFFFTSRYFPLKRKWCGYLYAILFTSWWIAFMFYPNSIIWPGSQLGFIIFIITIFLNQREDNV